MLINNFCSMKLEIPYNYECISIARMVTTQFAKLIGFSQQEEFKLQLAVDEACSNIIDAATKVGNQNGLIKLLFASKDQGLEVIIQDQGPGFDPTILKNPSFQEYNEIAVEGGRGIFLMSELMDHFEIKSSPTGTQVKFTKKIV